MEEVYVESKSSWVREELELYAKAIIERLEPYAKWAKDWWDDETSSIYIHKSGVVTMYAVLPGLFIKTGSSLKKALVYGLQRIPCVAVKDIKFKPIPMGAVSLLKKMDAEGQLLIDDIRFIPKFNLSGTTTSGHFLCMVPQDIFQKVCKQETLFGRVYISVGIEELRDLSVGVVPFKLKELARKEMALRLS